MNELIEHIPLPWCGITTAVASLGILYEPFAPALHVLCGVLATCMIAPMLLKIALFPKAVRTDLRDPVLSGIAGTFTMALLALSSYLASLSPTLSFCVWAVAVGLYALLVVNFVARLLTADDRSAFLTPASFIVLVSYVLADLTGPDFGVPSALREGVLRAGAAMMVASFALVTARYALHPPRQESLRPLLCIYTAPPSMCLAGLLVVIPDPPALVVGVWHAAASGFYLFALVTMLRCLKLRFYPSYASMTFPFVISATATFEVASFFSAAGAGALPLFALGCVQLAIATCITAYVLVRYCLFLARFAHTRAERAKRAGRS